MAGYLRFWLSMFLFTHLLAITMIMAALIWIKFGGAESLPVGLPATSIESPSPTVTPSLPGTSSSPAAAGPLKLIIPVAGVGGSNLRDTFNDARSQGRIHNAIDIMAPRGTAVLAASDGEIIRLFSSDLGGNTIYQFSPDHQIVFYYAHLERYAAGIVAGHQAHQGEVIAYVGDTGNAGKGNYHLHFAIWRVTDPKRYWDGVNINPYPILKPFSCE